MTGASSNPPHGWGRKLSPLFEILRHRDMLVIAAIAFVYGTTETMIRPLVAPYAVTMGAGPMMAGVAVAVQSLPGLFFAVPVGSAIDKHGSRKVLLAGGLGLTVGSVLLAMAANLTVLTGAVLLVGVGTVGLGIAVQSLAAESVAGGAIDTRRVAGWATFALVGHLVGPALGGVVTDLSGYSSAFWIAAVLGGILIGIGVVYRKPSLRDVAGDDVARFGSERGNASSSYRRAGALLHRPGLVTAVAVSALGTLLMSLRISFLPLYLDQIGWTASAIGLLLSGAGVAALVARAFFSMIDRLFDMHAVLIGCVVFGAVTISLAVATTSTATILITIVSSGALLGIVNPGTLTLLSRHSEAQQRGVAVGIRLSANRLSQGVGPFGFGMLAAASGLRPAFWVFTAIAALGTAFTRRG